MQNDSSQSGVEMEVILVARVNIRTEDRRYKRHVDEPYGMNQSGMQYVMYCR